MSDPTVCKSRYGTSVVVDHALLAEALRVTASKTEGEVIEHALRILLQLKRQDEIRSWRGQLKWDGDLGRSRRD